MIAGKVEPEMKNYFNYLKDLITKLNITKKVKWKGHVSSLDMLSLLSSCKIFL